eukprot:gene9402-1610_t
MTKENIQTICFFDIDVHYLDGISPCFVEIQIIIMEYPHFLFKEQINFKFKLLGICESKTNEERSFTLNVFDISLKNEDIIEYIQNNEEFCYLVNFKHHTIRNGSNYQIYPIFELSFDIYDSD